MLSHHICHMLSLYFLVELTAFGVSPTKLGDDYPQEQQRRCRELNQAADCVKLAKQASDHGQLEVAQSWYRMACNLGIASACVESGKIWMILGNEERALRDLNRACAMPSSDGTACYHIGEIATLKQGPQKAKTWFAKACRQGFNPACK